MIVAGVMSGTSADGIDVALVRVSDRTAGKAARRSRRGPGRSQKSPIRFQLLGQAAFPYSKPVRQKVLASMNATHASVADLARLNFLLAELYAEAVLSAQKQFRVRVQLVGCHGQTLYHQGEPENFLGHNLGVTWQTGEGALIAARVGVPVVSDFRPADMAAGGKGAPLVPFLDYLLYRDQRIGRIVQNIGGIANLTAIAAGARTNQVLAFDTGPGNMVIDAVTERLFHKPYDRDGRIAAFGNVMQQVVLGLLRDRFFLRKPPRTAGREEFGHQFAEQLVRACGSAPKENVVATATALTAQSIADAVRRFVIKRNVAFGELVVSGGGAKNPTLLAMLGNELRPFGLRLRLSDEFGLPSAAKEAAAFALLAYETWNRRPSNLPSATGARQPAILGKISYV